MQRAVAQDVRGPRQLGREQPVAEAELVAQRDGRRFLDEQRVGTGIDDELADPLGLDDAAGRDSRSRTTTDALALRELVGRGETGDAAADDGNVDRSSSEATALDSVIYAGAATACATSAASARMNVGEVFSDACGAG